MTAENRERLMKLLRLLHLGERAHLQRLPDEVVDFFVAKLETTRRDEEDARTYISTVRGWASDYFAERARLERVDEVSQSIYETIHAYDSEGLGAWQSDFDHWHARHAVKH